ncbi:MAG: MBL fold metallo-hydrolase [Candidatus Terrybacteria bacterium]|nr:MBL fold metallo-hydrolase [Candidatus Terrybacteria bacterium]
MIITYYGASCFKVQSGETVLVFNPPSKESEFKSPRFAADAVLISANHKDYNGWENIPAKEEGSQLFVIDSPGEYEIKGLTIKGLFDGLNTIYVLIFEDISLCHLGRFKEKEIKPEIKEEIAEVDILFIPVSEDDGQRAGQFVAQIEPKIAIPMHYKESDLKKFLKEFGNGSIKPVEKLTIKKKDLGEETQVIVISSQ